jgi:c-di-GMP-binding flagellar brake protein YcgR
VVVAVAAKSIHLDRRRYRRARAPIYVRPVGARAYAVKRQVNDISLGGLRAYSDEGVKPGTRLEMELFFSDGDSATVLAEVVWVEALPEGAPARFDVGLRYVQARPEDLERIAQVLGDD